MNLKAILSFFISSFLTIFSFLILTPIINMDLSSEDVKLDGIAMLTKNIDYIDEPVQKYTYLKENVPVCSTSSVKSYMSYRAITNTSSAQYKYIRSNMYVDQETGLLRNKEHPEYIGVALGTYFGKIGSMYEFTLDSGIVLKVVKIDVKSDAHTYNGCYHRNDSSVIELVIDTAIARKHFGSGSNKYILNGNFNNAKEFRGRIKSIEKVTVIENKGHID